MAVSGITGQTGEIRVGGRVAARLGYWSAQRVVAEDKWVIGAALVERNDLWLAGAGPFELRLDVGSQQWRWKPVDLAVEGNGATVTAYRRFETV